MAFVFEHVKESEADKVLSLYRSLVGTPFCAWTADYPARSDVEFDLSRNALFCLRDKETGEMAGVISIDQDPKVESLTCWTPELQPGRELSRLGVREAYQNQGIARRLMTGAMDLRVCTFWSQRKIKRRLHPIRFLNMKQLERVFCTNMITGVTKRHYNVKITLRIE